jgi:ribose transport system ATP-binding protein
MANLNTVPAFGDHRGFSIRGVGKTYNRTVVLQKINLDIAPGEVVALLGENGAGKSTLSGIIAGSTQPDDGAAMQWEGKPYAPASPREAIAAGVGMIHQEMRLLPELSIAENVFVGRVPMKNGRVDREQMITRSEAQLKRLGLDISATRKVGTLRVAAQQQVEIAKALTLNARLLILDEPTAALGAAETDHLFKQIKALKQEGVSFIYISHRLDEIARIADRVVVLRDGQQVAAHDSGQVPLRTLVEQMVGRNVERMFPAMAPAQDKVVLEVRDLCGEDEGFRNISFSVNAGEVFGIAGIVGAGRTELVRAIAGADPVTGGQILIDGQPVRLRDPQDAIRAGVSLVPEDRKLQGVVLEHSIENNLTYGNFDQLGAGGWVRPSGVRAFADKLIGQLGIKGRAAQPASDLSGGNQQKIVIAKCIARSPKVIILDEPTRGIDVGARAAIYEVMAGLARSGMAVIVVSSDLDEVLGLSHRVLVISRGEARGILPRDQANSVAVMELATL